MKGTHTVSYSYQVYYSNFKLRIRLIITAAYVQHITDLEIAQKILFYSDNNLWSMEGVIPILQKKLSLTETVLHFTKRKTRTGSVLTWIWVTWFKVSAPSFIPDASTNESYILHKSVGKSFWNLILRRKKWVWTSLPMYTEDRHPTHLCANFSLEK